MNWKEITHLKTGTRSQRRVYRDLAALNILNDLKAYDATHASSFVLGLDRAESDIDIICEVYDPAQFVEYITSRYGSLPGFAIQSITEPAAAIVASFSFQDSTFEVFAQPLPVVKQNGFRHMVQTHRVLTLGGTAALEGIRALREQGHKTEPAIALFLGLVERCGETYSGDPFQELLTLELIDDTQIAAMIRKRCGDALLTSPLNS